MPINENVQIVQEGAGLTEANPLPINEPDIGAIADAAVTNPALSGSVIALLKGILTGINSLVVNSANTATITEKVTAIAVDTAEIVTNTAPLNSTVQETAEYNKTLDTTLELALVPNGNALTGINDGTLDLIPGTDYTMSGMYNYTKVTLAQAYMQAQDVGDLVLTFSFTAGTNAVCTVTVSAS